jgi:hypothetical protein
MKPARKGAPIPLASRYCSKAVFAPTRIWQQAGADEPSVLLLSQGIN